MNKKKKVILVSGASYGIGRAIATQFAAKGYHPVLIARSEDGLAETKANIDAKGGECTVLCVDLKNYSEVESSLNKLASELGKFDCLWSGAFGYLEGETSASKVEEVQDIFDAGVIGAIHLTKQFLNHAADNPNVFIVAADWNFPENKGLTAFISAKKALEGFGLALQKELHGKAKIYVVCPADVSSHSHPFDAEPDLVKEETAGSAIATIELAQLCYSFTEYETLFLPKIYIHPLSQKYSVTYSI